MLAVHVAFHLVDLSAKLLLLCVHSIHVPCQLSDTCRELFDLVLKDINSMVIRSCHGGVF